MTVDLQERKIPLLSTDDSAPQVIPDSFKCPITTELMQDPVIAADGHSYERAAIHRWIITLNRNTSPMTAAPLANRVLIPNHSLKKAIAEFREKPASQAASESSALAILSSPSIARDALSAELIEELQRRNRELKEVRRILAETRREHAEEKMAELGLAASLLDEEKRQAEGECPSLKTVVGSVLGLTAVAEAIALAVVLTKKSNGSDSGCVEPVYPTTYDIPYSDMDHLFDFALTYNTDTYVTYDGVEFANGANITKVYTQPWQTQPNLTLESTPLPGIGFLHKIIFTEGWKVRGQYDSISFRCDYDPATSIGPWTGAVNIFPPKNYPVQAYIRGEGKVFAPISGLSTCTRSPTHGYTHGAYVGRPWSGWYFGGTYKIPPFFATLTSLFYALIGAKPDGTIYPLTDWEAQAYLTYLAQFRLKYPLLTQEVYLMLGGPCSFELFSKIANDPAAFAKLQQNLLKTAFSFDASGMVLDLQSGAECPGSFNETLFVQLHEGIAETLRPFGKKLHSTLPAISPLSTAALCKVGSVIDKAHLKTYDYANFPGGISSDAAGLNKVVDSVQAYLSVEDRGTLCLRPEQILVGAPSFARGVTVTNTSTNYGYGQLITGWMQGELGPTWTYRCIAEHTCVGSAPPFPLITLPPSQSPSGKYSAEAWAYQRNGTAILSLDTPYSICKKIQYVKAEGQFAPEQPLGGYFLLYTDGDTSDGKLTSAADTAFSTKDQICSDTSIAESTSEATSKRPPILPLKVLEAMAESAKAGSFYGFLYELHRRGLTDLLAPQGYSPREIYCIEKTLQTVYNLGSLGCAASGVSLLLVQLGLPKEAVDKAIGNTALAAGLWFAFWPTVGCIGGSIAGSMVAAPCYHYVVKPAARAMDATMATAVSTVMAPLGNAAGALAGAAAKTAYEAAGRAGKSWVGTAVGTAASTAVGIAGKAADRYRKSWLGSAVSTATTPVGTLSDAVLKAAGTTRVGIAVGAATSSARASFWAKASPVQTSTSAPSTAASSGESLAIELAK